MSAPEHCEGHPKQGHPWGRLGPGEEESSLGQGKWNEGARSSTRTREKPGGAGGQGAADTPGAERARGRGRAEGPARHKPGELGEERSSGEVDPWEGEAAGREFPSMVAEHSLLFFPPQFLNNN